MATKKPSKFDPGALRKTRGRPLGSKNSSKSAPESLEDAPESVEEVEVGVEAPVEVPAPPEPVQAPPAPQKPRYKATQNFNLNVGGRIYVARRGDVIEVSPCDIREFTDRGIIVSF